MMKNVVTVVTRAGAKVTPARRAEKLSLPVAA
jgi:hypothetical protein